MASNWPISWCDFDVFMSCDAVETVYATSLAARGLGTAAEASKHSPGFPG